CSDTFKSKETFRKHVLSCQSCTDADSPPNKRQRIVPEVAPEATSEATTEVEQPVHLSSKEISQLAQLGAEVLRCLDKLDSSTINLIQGIPSTSTKIPRKVSDWPSLVNSDHFIERDDSDLGINGLFDVWGESEGLQQKWTLLLVDAILVSADQTCQGRTVETYNRNRSEDAFAEHLGKKALSSVPSDEGVYKKIMVCTRPVESSNYITLGTTTMNAIFTVAAFKNSDGVREVGVGATACADYFRACATTRVFLAKDSIKAAKEHVGTRFNFPLKATYSLRAVFTNFQDESAFLYARAAREDLRLPGQMPTTVFTLGDFACSPLKFFEGLSDETLLIAANDELNKITGGDFIGI
ncbi:hypothetical protein BGX34_004826, partial [Mortierella sp. NVP85]